VRDAIAEAAERLKTLGTTEEIDGETQ